MSTNTVAATEKESGEGITSQYVLLFELEGAAIDGRTKLFEAAKAVFDQAGVKLTDGQFARYCTQAATPAIVGKLIEELGQDKLPADAEEKILADYASRISSGVSLHPLFQNLLEETSRRGIRAAALTILPEETAEAVFNGSGLASRNVELHIFAESERHFPRVDCWMKICRQIAKSPRACIAVAGCRDSGKSALSSGMRCLIIPDAFTGYQDFSGVDAVLDSADAYDLVELIDTLT